MTLQLIPNEFQFKFLNSVNMRHRTIKPRDLKLFSLFHKKCYRKSPTNIHCCAPIVRRTNALHRVIKVQNALTVKLKVKEILQCIIGILL